MKDKGSRLISTVVIAALLLSTSVLSAAAHFLTGIDGDPGDWANLSNSSCAAAPGENTSAIITIDETNITACGLTVTGTEWVWTDPNGDERTDLGNPDTRVDIVEFRVTSDPRNLYFYVEMADIATTAVSGTDAPMVQIAIDTDLLGGSGYSEFLRGADTSVSDFAYWERLVVTTFGSGGTRPVLYAPTPSVSSNAGSEQAISANNNLIEIQVPWALLPVGPGSSVRLTVATFRAQSNDNVRPASPSMNSNVLDAITTEVDTSLEVQDGTLDYYFDVFFDEPTSIELKDMSAASPNNTVLPLALFLGAAALLALGYGLRFRGVRAE